MPGSAGTEATGGSGSGNGAGGGGGAPAFVLADGGGGVGLATGGFLRLHAVVVATSTRTRAVRRMRRTDIRDVSLRAWAGAQRGLGEGRRIRVNATNSAARCCPPW